MRYEVYFPDHNPSQLVPGHTGVLGGPHVVVGDVDVRVAHPAELHVESDVQLAPDIPLDVNPLELGVPGGPGEAECGVHGWKVADYFLRAVNTIDYIPTVGVNEYNCSLIT